MSATHDRIDLIREAIKGWKVERDGILRAPRPLAEQSESLKCALDRVTKDFNPKLQYLHRAETPADVAFSLLSKPFLAQITHVELTSFIVVLCRRELDKVLLDRIRAELAITPAGLPAAERERKIAELDMKISDAERDEELLIRSLERTGFDVARRTDASPAAQVAFDRDLETAARAS